MAYETLLLERDGPIAVITVNRPAVRNALNAPTLEELRHAMLDLKADETVRAVILTGAGEKAFVAGADINEMAGQSPAGARELSRTAQQVFDVIENLGKPVIAAINGFALGGGCELAMACTLRLAADTATLGQPEVNLGLMPGYGGTQRLPRLVGRARAMELTLLGTAITAAEAGRIGLVNRVVPAAELMSEARKLAAQLARNAPVAMRNIMSAINKGLDMTLAEGCVFEATLFGLTAATDDMREGTTAFLEKRAPVFKGK